MDPCVPAWLQVWNEHSAIIGLVLVMLVGFLGSVLVQLCGARPFITVTDRK